MTIGSEPIVLDTNVWIFGLREQQDRIYCGQLLEQIPHLHQIYIPRQILLELQANLSNSEMRDLFLILNRYPEQIGIRHAGYHPPAPVEMEIPLLPSPQSSPEMGEEVKEVLSIYIPMVWGASLATRLLPPMLKALG